jgi:hypothetical protein
MGLPPARRLPILREMFLVNETDAAAIRAIFDEQGELSAAIELRRLFPGVLSIEARAMCAIGTTSSVLIRYPTLGGATL